MIISNILDSVGNTPMVSLTIDDVKNVNLFAKVETYNPTGSVKDRAASFILKKLLERKEINKDTTIIESTSGNFGVALSAFCNFLGLRFIAVVDPHITRTNEMLIRANKAEMIKVDKPDQYGGYLLTRIEKVRELISQNKNSYWVNQYGNPLNSMSYYHSLGKEICYQIENIDYIFLGISSGGTITGVSKKIRENFPRAKIIAVDVEGSLIFNQIAKKRFIPGIGSSMRPQIIDEACIDDVVLTNEVETIYACQELLGKYHLFLGGSSGSVFAAIKKHFAQNPPQKSINVVTVFADRGERYFDTIYNPEWVEKVIGSYSPINATMIH